MFHKIKHLFSGAANVPIFVIGTGRSGTHWVGYSLATHPEIRATVEVAPMFEWSRQMAMNPGKEPVLLPKLIRNYRWQLLRSTPRHYLDKNHPNIWIAEALLAAFPNALFIGIERNPFATVASMMKHQMVASWPKRWREFPVPNRFLGIDKQIAATYDTLPLSAQCALRWVAHHQRMEELKQTLKGSLRVIQYESFAEDPAKHVRELQSFLPLTQPIPIPEVKSESLDKWKTQLSPEDLDQISRVVGFAPEQAHTYANQ